MFVMKSEVNGMIWINIQLVIIDNFELLLNWVSINWIVSFGKASLHKKPVVFKFSLPLGILLFVANTV